MTVTELLTTMPVADFKLQLRFGDGPWLAYQPQQDITPYELALILKLYLIAQTGSLQRCNGYEQFMTSNNLLRHFSVNGPKP